MITHLDLKGQPIAVGNLVVFVDAGHYKSIPPMKYGEVVGLTKAAVKVRYLNKDLSVETYDEYVDDRSQPPYYSNGSTNFYHQVKTGKKVEKDPVSIKYFDDRFLVIEQP